MQITLAVAALLALAFAEAKSTTKELKPTTKEPKRTNEPEFCNGIECPHFKIINKTDKYEVRSYPTPYKWASTVVAGFEYDEAVRMGFMRLFDYIQGENVKKMKIPMTAPVAVEIQPGQGPFCENNFTINFFVPFEDQADPAAPTNKDVFISNFPAFTAYVIVYGGYSNITAIQKYSEQLAKDLVEDGLGDTFIKDVFFFAGYDSPFKPTNRHNEIWFLRKDSDAKPILF